MPLAVNYSGFSVSEEQKVVAEMSGVLEVAKDFMSTEMRRML